MLLHAEHEAIAEQARAGMIPEGVAEAMLEDLAAELRGVRASQPGKLAVGPEELLKKVPFFTDMPEGEFSTVATKLRRRTVPAGEIIVRQSGSGSSLFLVARGVVRVSRQDGGVTRDLATLIAGEFFGEMAFLHGTRRTATCRAMTPWALYRVAQRRYRRRAKCLPRNPTCVGGSGPAAPSQPQGVDGGGRPSPDVTKLRHLT